MEADPVSERDWDDAHLINAAIDIHHDDPEFGYRFIADELAERGIAASPRTGCSRLCTQQRHLQSVHSTKRGSGRKPGPAGPRRPGRAASSPPSDRTSCG